MNHRVKGAGIGNGVWQRDLRCLLPRIGCEGKGLGSEGSTTSQFPRILHSGYPAFSRGWVTRTASYPQTGRRGGKGKAEKQIATQNSLGEPEKLVTQNSPPAQGTGGEGGGQRSNVFLGCLRGMGHYQDFSMADILERVEFKRVGGERKRRQLRGKFQFPYYAPAPLAQPNPRKPGRGLAVVASNQQRPGTRLSQSRRARYNPSGGGV